MRHRSTSAPLTLLAAIAALLAGTAAANATCGGGGGGGEGGFGTGTSGSERVYHVPWKVIAPGADLPTGDLVLYWFPSSPSEARVSPLQSSRRLTEWSGECVAMALVTADNADVRSRFHAVPGVPVAVLASPDDTEITRIEADAGRLDSSAVEKALAQALDAREEAAKAALESAKARAKAGDLDGAAALYEHVVDQRCLLPALAKKATQALEEMGRPVPAAKVAQGDGPRPDLSPQMEARMTATLQAGLAAEQRGDAMAAVRAYEQARDLDPGDPVPLRFLGEMHRHHTGDWAQARAIFNSLLARPADPLSRAVALHGLGKMTIHEGDFAGGLALFERSLQSYPLALTYRNLAVYWASEHQPQKAWGYVEKALALAPDETYNQIFAATQYVALGRRAEAESVARRYAGMLAASYNLAAIHAQLGHRDQALALLRRHFYAYEHTDAVRRREMQEARDDVVFARYRRDPAFVSLTALADGRGAAAMPSGR